MERERKFTVVVTLVADWDAVEKWGEAPNQNDFYWTVLDYNSRYEYASDTMYLVKSMIGEVEYNTWVGREDMAFHVDDETVAEVTFTVHNIEGSVDGE